MQETGVHVPNLVVVQDEEGHEWVFKGANTCKDFCDWLFGGSMNGAVCIAHNFKGYDSYFILKYLYDNMVAMAERDAWDRTFWMGVVNIHAPPTSFTDAFTTGVPSAFLETRSIQSAV